MPYTKEEMLEFCLKVQKTKPHITKEELAELLRKEFFGKDIAAAEAHEDGSAGLNAASPEKEVAGSESGMPDPEPEAAIEPDIESEAVRITEPAAEAAEEAPNQPGLPADVNAGPDTVLPVKAAFLSRRAVLLTLAVAFFTAVTAAYWYIDSFLPSPPPSKEAILAVIANLEKSPPDETGDVIKFGKRFAAQPGIYQDKYKKKVLEMAGVVDRVKKSGEPPGYEVTLVLAENNNKVYRAVFLFEKEQEDAVNGLVQGTTVALKGYYQGCQDKVPRFHPAVIVFNGASSP